MADSPRHPDFAPVKPARRGWLETLAPRFKGLAGEAIRPRVVEVASLPAHTSNHWAFPGVGVAFALLSTNPMNDKASETEAKATLVQMAAGRILRGGDAVHLSDLMRWAGAPAPARWAIESALRPECAARALALWV